MSVMPMLSYSDPVAAIAFLTAAFGFEEVYRLDMPGGAIGHCELTLGDARIALSSAWPDAGLMSPSELPGVPCQFAVRIEDVNAHFERARDAGATIVTEPEDQFYGFRMYRVNDLEGHRWVFQQKLKDLSVEEMQAMMQ